MNHEKKSINRNQIATQKRYLGCNLVCETNSRLLRAGVFILSFLVAVNSSGLANQTIAPDSSQRLVPVVPALSNAGQQPVNNGLTIHTDAGGQLQKMLEEEMAPPLKPATPFTGFKTAVATTPNGKTDLSVVVNANGSATVTWNQKKYKSNFDFVQGKVVVTIQNTSQTKEELTLSFREEAGQFSLKSLKILTQIISGASSRQGETTMTFKSGELATQTEIIQSGSGANRDQYKEVQTYTKVNGKLLLESRMISDKMLGQPNSSTYVKKDFFQYDQKGNEKIHLTIEGLEEQRFRMNVSYVASDSVHKTKMTVSTVLSDRAIYDALRSAADYAKLDSAALSKRVDYFADSNLSTLTATVDFRKNGSGEFVPEPVYFSNNLYYLVRHAADLFSNESDDIAMKPSQTVNGYQITVKPLYFSGSQIQKGLEISFSNQALKTVTTQVNGKLKTAQQLTGEVVVLSQYPTENKVKLGGVLYAVNFDAAGNAILKQVTVEALQAELLRKIDPQIEAAKSKLLELETVLANTLDQLRNEKQAILAQISDLDAVGEKLKEIAAREGVEESTQEKIGVILTEIDTSQPKSVQRQVVTFFQSEETRISNLGNANIEKAEASLENLEKYRVDILSVETVSRLEQLPVPILRKKALTIAISKPLKFVQLIEKSKQTIRDLLKQSENDINKFRAAQKPQETRKQAREVLKFIQSLNVIRLETTDRARISGARAEFDNEQAPEIVIFSSAKNKLNKLKKSSGAEAELSEEWVNQPRHQNQKNRASARAVKNLLETLQSLKKEGALTDEQMSEWQTLLENLGELFKVSDLSKPQREEESVVTGGLANENQPQNIVP